MLRSFVSVSTLIAGAVALGAQSVIRGVNLGGWLVTEPWMTPSLFDSTKTVDEWTLCNALGKEKCLSTLQDHWSNFYSRDDISQIAGAGLNSIRIPLGYWAVDLLDYEPYVSGQYPYLIQAVHWAQEFGLTVMIDLHGAPGSQNGWEETGLVGAVDFPANSSNAERSLNVIRNLTVEFSKEEYGGVVTNIELLNEPLLGFPVLTAFYTDGYNTVRGNDSAHKINVTIHDGFLDPHTWENYDPNNPSAQTPADNLVVDTHQFWAFPPLDNLTKPEILDAVCTFGQTQLKETAGDFHGIPPVLVGEWSLSTGITANTSSNTEEDQDKRTWFRQLFEAQNAAFTPNAPGQPSIGWYFWAWKTEYNIDAWSYQKGLQDQYIPSNISDPSTYIFPIKKNGCIDASHRYTAPALVSSTAPLPTATGTSTDSGTSAASSGNTKQSSASSLIGASSLWMLKVSMAAVVVVVGSLAFVA